ncbi:modifier of mdg4-like isoform X6 [Anopheles albimanus]|uniref:modifier of mdg4-like isoform X6 n=1 Tax=Anopheles albimanus TaxID=7167 RepID=UPI00163FE765|nr:modifier of mdg4-like isoform X6 [Anopheles albimanus]
MADDEQFSLCWNNFNSNLSAGFHDSLVQGDLVDVTLAAEGHLVKAHRLILSVCSPYFRKMFMQMPVNQHAFIFLKDVSHSVLKDLIQFMYCGEVNVKQEALPGFISTAEALQIKGLTETGDSAPPQASPAKEIPSTPAPVSISTSNTVSPRGKSQRTRAQSYKLESEESGDDKIVQIQTPASHHSVTVSQQVQQVQQLHVASGQKRVLGQRHVQPSQITKRAKISVSSTDVLDPSDNTTQIQTVQIVKQLPSQPAEPEYVDLAMESINTKAEPDYAEEPAEIETVEAETEQDQSLTENEQTVDQEQGDDGDQYVDDDAYGELSKYDESYFTEGEDGKPGASGFGESYASDGTSNEQASQDPSEMVQTVHTLKGRLKQLCSRYKIVQNPNLIEIHKIQSTLRSINSEFRLSRGIDPRKPIQINGFSMPLQCEEDIDRLELMVKRNPKIRLQYIEFLRCKKDLTASVSECFEKFFADEAIYNFKWNAKRNAKTRCKAMQDYQIFTVCMLAWHEHGVTKATLASELQLMLTIINRHRNAADHIRSN